MMRALKLGELSGPLRARVINGDTGFSGVSIDSRAVRPGDLFIAIKGASHDGHDYVDFLQRNPRYRAALDTTSDPAAYFDALQRAGYATDPAYADKIKRILDSEPVQRIRRQVQEGTTVT